MCSLWTQHEEPTLVTKQLKVKIDGQIFGLAYLFDHKSLLEPPLRVFGPFIHSSVFRKVLKICLHSSFS